MKMTIKLSSLFLALIIIFEVFTIVPAPIFAEDNSNPTTETTPITPDNTENYIEGKVKIDCDGSNNVSLNKGEKLYAFTTLDSSLDEGAKYSWEIKTAENKWTTISGYVFHFAVISEALLHNALKVNDTASIRCIVTINDEKYVSDILAVTLSTSDNQTAPASQEEMQVAEEPNIGLFSLRANADTPSLASDTESDVFQIVINYTYRHNNEAKNLHINGQHAHNTFTVTLPENTYYTGTVSTPLEIGYLPFVKISQAQYVTGAPQTPAELEAYIQANKISYGVDEQGEPVYYVPANSIQFNNQTDNITVDVYFIPQLVTYSVKIFEQNLYDDEYTLAATITKTGIANSPVGKGLDENRVGFSSLYYDPEVGIDEDGSFVVELYYDRIYYLVDFDLNDNNEAYGVTNHYARYKTTVVLPPATRPGYAFINWELTSVKNDLKDTEQVTDHSYPKTANGGYIIHSVEHNLDYKANWEVGKTSYTVIYWLENADDDSFTLDSFKTVTDITPGTVVSATDDLAIDDKSCFTFNADLSDKNVVVSSDGTTAINVYYLRKYYTMTFNGNSECITKEHTHTDECKVSNCGIEAHVHTDKCGNAELICNKEEHNHVDECCTIIEHAHDSSCCSVPYHVHGTGANSDCTKPEHPLHHDTCFSRNTLKEATSLTNTSQKNAYTALQNRIGGPLNGYIYRIRTSRNGTIYNFLFVHNKWFYLGTGTNYNGVSASGIANPASAANSYSSAEATAICGYEIHSHGDGNCTCKITEHDHTTGCTCQETRHVHGEGDCNYNCNKEQHRHIISCYKHNCGKTAHTHGGDCRRACQLVEHTHNTNCQTKQTQNFLQFTAKYDADISKIWASIEALEKKGNLSEGVRWKDSNSAYFSQVLVYLPFMPPANITFKSDAGTASKPYTINYYLESLGATDIPYKNKYFDLNNSIGANYNYLTPDEDFFDIRGFTQFESNPAESGGQIKDTTDYVVDLYYSRNEYKLEFVSLGTTISAQTQVLKYQQPIGASYELMAEDVPYPSTKEKGAIKFVGWYLTPNCADGTEFVFDGSTTMPVGGLVLYAKWEACSYTAKIYTDKTKTTLFDSQTVLFDSFIDEPNYLHIQHPDLGGNHPGGLPGDQHPDIDDEDHKIFTGWYYLVDGQPVRFDFNTMSVKFDMELYAGWTTRTPVPYKVRYVIWDGQQYIDIADPTSGMSLAGITKTFIAKVGEELYDKSDEDPNNIDPNKNYRVRCFPDLRSHTMVMGENKDETTEFLFVYSYMDVIEYEVKHLFTDTIPEKSTKNLTVFESILGVGNNTITLTMSHKIQGEEIKNQAASVAVSFREGITKDNIVKAVKTQYGIDLKDPQAQTIWETVINMSPNYFIQDLILTTDNDQNNATFQWTDSRGQALYQIIYYIESVDGTEYVISKSQQALVNKGTEIDATKDGLIIDIDRFKFDSTNPLNITNGEAIATTINPDGTLAKGLVLKLYYKRIEYPYTVLYYKEGTTDDIAVKVSSTAKYESTIFVSDVAKTIEGYTLTNPNDKLVIGDNKDQVIICKYQGLEVNYLYQIMGNMGGTIKEPTDTVKIGSEPSVKTLELWNEGYFLNAWYYSVGNGELQPVPGDWIKNNTTIKPETPKVEWAGKTIYIYAEVLPTTRRFSVEGFETSENDPQAFVFRLQGTGTATAGIDVTFTIFDIGYLDIEKLPYGEYTLTTLHWAWRLGHPEEVIFNGAHFNATSGTVTLKLDNAGDVIIKYPSTFSEKWLSDDASGIVPLEPKNNQQQR